MFSVGVSFIPGVMLGVEFPAEGHLLCVLDLLIVRVVFIKGAFDDY